jgi:enoyl-CoA hydratase/carnithine racemase
MALVLFEKDGNTLRVSLNRRSALNALNSAVLQELEQGLRKYQEDEAVRSVIVFGQGGCFAAGADIGELASLDEEGIRRFHQLRERTFLLLENFPPPLSRSLKNTPWAPVLSWPYAAISESRAPMQSWVYLRPSSVW